MFVTRTQDSLDYNAARILEEVRRDEAITQRELSNRLGIALGVINSYIRRLARKGHLKVTTLPRNRLKYFVTPSGLALKARLTYEYAVGSLHFYRDARIRARILLRALETDGVRHVGFLGYGDLTEIVFTSLQETRLLCVGVFDDGMVGRPFFRLRVRSESEIFSAGAERLIYTKPNWTTDPPYLGPLPVVQFYG